MDPATRLRTPDPLNVTPVLDTGRTVKKTIGSAGGTMTVTNAKGTVFTLTIPADALPSDADIQMTPLSSIGGLPFSGGLVGAVDLKPDGLRFFKPAILSIQPVTMPPLGEQAPFQYLGSGEDFHSYPLSMDKTKLEMALMHFTGAGVATAPPSERDALANRAPSNVEAQFAAEGARIVDRWRRGVIDGEGFASESSAYLEQAFKQIVRPRLQAAETDDSLAALAISSFNTWARQGELLGISDRFETLREEGWASVAKIIQNAFDKSYERCIAGEVGFVQRMIGWARAAALLSIPLPADSLERADNCLRFELDYELGLKYRKSSGNMERFDLTVKSDRAPLRLDDYATGQISGPVPLAAPLWEHYDNICNQTGGTATVTRDGNAKLKIDANLKYKVEPDGRVITSSEPPTIKMDLDTGHVAVTSSCGLGDKKYYRTFMSFLYPDLYAPPGPPPSGSMEPHVLQLQNWTYTTTNPWAQLLDTREKSGLALNDLANGSLTLRLHHKPVP